MNLILLPLGVLFLPNILPYFLSIYRQCTNIILGFLSKFTICNIIYDKFCTKINKSNYLIRLYDSTMIKLHKTNLIINLTLKLFWINAWTIIQLKKIFETCLRMIFWLPDSLFVVINILQRPIYTTDGIKITILNVMNERQTITNKFKLFLSIYWESDSDQHGFLFNKLNQLFNCSIVYLSYMLGEIKFENPATDKFRVMWLDSINNIIDHVNFDDPNMLNYDSIVDELRVLCGQTFNTSNNNIDIVDSIDNVNQPDNIDDNMPDLISIENNEEVPVLLEDAYVPEYSYTYRKFIGMSI